MPNPPADRGSRFIPLASITLVVAALYFAREIFIPIALAILLSFLLAPAARRLERWNLHRALSVAIVMLLSLGVIGALGYVFYDGMRNVAQHVPEYSVNVKQKIETARQHAGWFQKFMILRHQINDMATAPATTMATTESTTQTVTTIVPALPAQPLAAPASAPQPMSVRLLPDEPTPIQVVQNNIGPILSPIGTLLVVLIFAIFMLVQREDLRDRVIRLVGQGQLNLTTNAMDEAATRVSRYLVAQSLINGCVGVAVAIALWLIGVPNPVLWGLLAGALRFIPYIGIWLAAIPPMALSLGAFPGAGHALGTIAIFVGIEFIMGNFVEPYLVGASTGIATLAVLVAAAFWAWLWGPVGLLLSTPLTVCVVVMGKYVPAMGFLNILLTDEPVLEEHLRFYQRLLADDQEEALELVETSLKTKPIIEVYESILLPALLLAEKDHREGSLDEEKHQRIRQDMREMVEELGDRLKAGTLPQPAEKNVPAGEQSVVRPMLPKDCKMNVLLLPAQNEGEEIVGLMFAQVLELYGYCAFPIGVEALASEMVAQVEQKQADAIILSALPPGAVTHARYLCKRLHQKYPNIKLAIGLWHAVGDIKRARDRMSCVAAVQIVTTFDEALHELRQLVEPARLREAEKDAAPV